MLASLENDERCLPAGGLDTTLWTGLRLGFVIPTAVEESLTVFCPLLDSLPNDKRCLHFGRHDNSCRAGASGAGSDRRPGRASETGRLTLSASHRTYSRRV